LKLAIWSPLPPSPSGIADYVAESLPALSATAEIEVVCENPATVDPRLRALGVVCAPGEEAPADLDVYHVGNSPAHAYVYRAALARPGVVVLHDFNLHYLVLGETVERGKPEPYLREMRRAYRETGAFVGRQVTAALGGEVLPSLFPLNERLLETSLAVVTLSRATAVRAARALPGRPVLHLPHHLALPIDPVPGQAETRAALGLPADALVVTLPGLATAAKRINVALRVLGRLAPRFPSLHVVVAGGVDPRLPLGEWLSHSPIAHAVHVTGRLDLPDFIRHLVAADVVVALRFPSFGEMSGALVRAMGVGRPVIVTSGTPAAEEMPEGTLVPVDPGPREEEELLAFLERLLIDRPLREAIGRLAQEHVRNVHDLKATVGRLRAFLDTVFEQKAHLLSTVADGREDSGTLLGYFKEEVRWGARDLGLAGVYLGLDELLAELAGERA